MPNPWFQPRRSIEDDYDFYDSPGIIYKKITSGVWPYSENNPDRELLELRDLAYQCLMYGSTCRASELCRFDKKNDAGFLLFSKPSVLKSQFSIDQGLLRFREVIILKRSQPVLDPEGKQVYKNNKPQYKSIEDLAKYPTRNEITLPLEGDFSVFTKPIIEYLDHLEPEQELFPFKYRRGWQIVNVITGEMQHYLRSMGLKFYSRLLDRNIQDLQKFSGHARIQNLVVYLGEGNLEKKIKEVKF